uniref:Zinc finger CCHC domain-containing protein 7 n=1 Tax=Gasterosteus aculeatus aculeatus TaxID=481459 RepID=A0AAQ4PAR9_GASAC
MDYSIELEGYDGEQCSKDNNFFGDRSEGEEEINLSYRELHSIGKRAARLRRGSSPPLLLAYNITCGRALSTSHLHDEEEEEEEGEHPIEWWMLLGGEEQAGDSSIQLNLSYKNGSEDYSGDEDQTVKAVEDTWAVSDRDKPGAHHSLPSRYFTAGRSLFCDICKKTGHLAKSCYSQKKCPTCVLCGLQGHVQRHCGGRPCPSCGLPSHGRSPCERPQVWKQHCQRCGMSGHLSDTCPDTWRQYHLTIGLELPVRPQTDQILRNKKPPAHCYNCSKRGHHGYVSERNPSFTFSISFFTRTLPLFSFVHIVSGLLLPSSSPLFAPVQDILPLSSVSCFGLHLNVVFGMAHSLLNLIYTVGIRSALKQGWLVGLLPYCHLSATTTPSMTSSNVAPGSRKEPKSS